MKRSFGELKSVLSEHSKTFDLENFQNEFLKLIQDWAAAALPAVPGLFESNMASMPQIETQSSTSPAAKKENDRDEDSLAGFVRKESARDPSPPQPPSKKRRRTYKIQPLSKKRRRTYKIQFSSDSDDCGSQNNDGSTVHQPVCRKMPPRRKFTKEEDEAIKNGVTLCGVGKWSEIKAHNPIQLRNRSSVQIKDRWRTLNKVKPNIEL